MRSAKSSKNRKLLQTDIPFRYRKVIFALRDYVQKTQGDLQKLNSLDFNALLEDFEKVTKLKPDPAAFEAAANAGLLELKKNAADKTKSTLIFNPTVLVRTLIAMNVVKRLRTDPAIKDDEDQAKEDR
ncbi:MAG: hypothetical protein H7249_06545 [Chitinophagaceae bacterium]|nr:hypothetical protein [Oligoflexus sp.]